MNRIDLGIVPVKDSSFQILVDMARKTLPTDHEALSINHRKMTPYFRAHIQDILWMAECQRESDSDAPFDKLSSVIMGPLDVFWKIDKQIRPLLTMIYIKRNPELLIEFCETLLQLLSFYNEVALKRSKTANQRIINLLDKTFEVNRPNIRAFIQLDTLRNIKEICRLKYSEDESTAMQHQYTRISREMAELFSNPPPESGRQAIIQVK